MKVNCFTNNNQVTMKNTNRTWEAPVVLALDVEGTESGAGNGHEKTSAHYTDGLAEC